LEACHGNEHAIPDSGRKTENTGLTDTSQLIVSASGIRGVVGVTMTPDVAARYGAAFGRYLRAFGAATNGEAYVLVGRDSRASGERLASAAAAGLSEAGIQVRDAGIAPTPTLLLAVRDDDRAAAGLVVTASHNPIEWNGFKLASGDGRFLSPAAGMAVQDRFDRITESDPAYDAGDGGTLDGVAEHHIEKILALPLLDVSVIRERAPLVALDCVHGAGGAVVPELLRSLGCRVEGMGLATDGIFPRDPEPVPANLGELSRLVLSSGAEIGMAVDPDGDRLALVDGSGRPVGEDWTLALAAEYVLGIRKGPVVTNLSSSQSIEEVAERAGAEFYQTPVGEARVAERMLAVGAVIGGEGNGGVMLPDLNLTRDAAVAAALVLNLLAARRCSLEQLLAGRPRYHMVKRKTPRKGLDPDEIYSGLRRLAPPAAENTEDGLRLAWPDSREWLHVRPSGTEPILRVIAEAPSAGRAAELAGLVDAIVGPGGE
jgi:phosphomannomutase